MSLFLLLPKLLVQPLFEIGSSTLVHFVLSIHVHSNGQVLVPAAMHLVERQLRVVVFPQITVRKFYEPVAEPIIFLAVVKEEGRVPNMRSLE